MNKEFKLLSLKLKQSPLLKIDFESLVEAELWLTFKVFNKYDCRPKDIFLNFTKEYKIEYYWKSKEDLESDDAEGNFGYAQNNDWLVYKEKFDTFVYHKFFTWNLITQATIQEIRLLDQGINSHRYTSASAFQSCLETLNSWST